MQANQAFYQEVLGLPLEGDASYLSTQHLDGVKHFALWPISGAAQSCFGTESWPADLPVPQGWIEFDVDDVSAATAELENKGFRVLLAAKQKPWGQTVTRLLGFACWHYLYTVPALRAINIKLISHNPRGRPQGSPPYSTPLPPLQRHGATLQLLVVFLRAGVGLMRGGDPCGRPRGGSGGYFALPLRAGT